MNSPWGIEYNIIKQTGWTRKYVLWGVTWINIRLMLADAPAFQTAKQNDTITDPTLEELENFFSE